MNRPSQDLIDALDLCAAPEPSQKQVDAVIGDLSEEERKAAWAECVALARSDPRALDELRRSIQAEAALYPDNAEAQRVAAAMLADLA